MAKFSLRRYDHQARVGMIVSLASLVPLLGVMFLVFRHVDYSDWTIYYGPGRKVPLFAGAVVALLMAAIGLGLGWNSAGQRRNDKQQMSWIGFFVGAGVLCLTFLLMLLFRFRGESAG